MATPAKSKSSEPAVPVSRDAIAEAFAALVYLVPEAAPGDVMDIIGPILQATDWEQLNNTEKLPSSQTLVGHKLRVEKISRKPSDHPTGTGFYLLCEGVDLETGEQLRFTAGGTQAVAVLSKLFTLGNLPAFVQFSEVNTSAGNTAINAAVLGVDPGKGDPLSQ
jgi:hypothetical protein